MDASKFGAFIANVRKENNMTQLELASRLNVSDKTISKWETGKSLPDITMLEELSQALHISIVELMNMQKSEIETYSKDKVDEILVEFMNYNKRKKGNAYDYFFALCLMMLVFALLWFVAGIALFVILVLPVVVTVLLVVSIWRMYNRENYIVPLTLAVLIVGSMITIMIMPGL